MCETERSLKCHTATDMPVNADIAIRCWKHEAITGVVVSPREGGKRKERERRDNEKAIMR